MSERNDGAPVLVRGVRTFATPALLVSSMLAWLALRTAGLPALASSLLASLVMMAGILLLEIATPRPGLGPRPRGSLRCDLLFTATTTFVALGTPSLVAIPLGRAAGGALGTTAGWPTDLPLGIGVVLAVLVADLSSYWWHRLQHTMGSGWLWRLHSVHHSPRHLDFWSGGRVHPLDVLGFTVVGYGALAMLGAPVTTTEITAFFASMVGAVHHTRTDTNCGWLNRVVPFADHHVVHHSRLPHDEGNYGNITTLFDQLFRTYRTPTPRACAPLGAWSLAEDYPQGDYPFQVLSPFAGFWARATRRSAPRPDDPQAAIRIAI